MTVGRSHFVSQFVLANWKGADHKVAYVDLAADRIRRLAPRRLFVSPRSFPEDVELRLNSEIESPLSAYVARCKATPGGLIPSLSAKEDRALVLALFTQAVRTSHAEGSDGIDELSRLFAGGVSHLDALVEGARAYGSVVGANLTSDYLCMPSTGVVALPLPGARGWMMPITPRSFIAYLPKPASVSFLDRLLGIAGYLTHLSVGIRGDKIVIPPGVETDAGLLTWIKTARRVATEQNGRFAQINEATEVETINPFLASLRGSGTRA